MPANIAHLLICNKSVKALEDGGGYEEFVRILIRMSASLISTSVPPCWVRCSFSIHLLRGLMKYCTLVYIAEHKGG